MYIMFSYGQLFIIYYLLTKHNLKYQNFFLPDPLGIIKMIADPLVQMKIKKQ
jgi:hypothetical protein